MAGESLDLGDLLPKAQEMQRRIVLAQAELAETQVTRTVGGLVTVTMRGDGEVIRVAFDQAVFDDGDVESLAALTLSAIAQATAAVKAYAIERLEAVAASLQLTVGTESARYRQ